MNKQKLSKETETKPDGYTVLGNVILQSLKAWETPNHGEFDAMWYGYDSLMDEIISRGINPTLKEVKSEMKNLRNKGIIELKPCYDSDHTLCGRGYFIEATFNVA